MTPMTLARFRRIVLLTFGRRYCNSCHQARLVSDFPRNRAQKDGLSRECKACSKTRYMARPLAERNARVRSWMERNPQRAQQLGQQAASARRARVREAFVEHVDPRVLYQRDEGICGICDGPVSDRFDVDHIVPLVAGGEHSYANTRIAHPSCNRAKGRQQALLAAA